MRYKISWCTVLSGLRRKLRRLQSTASAWTTLTRQFLAAPSEFFLPPRKCLSPHPLPPTKSHIFTVPPCFSSSNLHCCLLAAWPPRRRPFFLQRRLLVGYPSCSTASSLPALLAARPRRYGQVINTPPTPSSFLVPHAPTDGATHSTEITAASSN